MTARCLFAAAAIGLLVAPAHVTFAKELKVGLREMPATRGNAYGGNGPPGIFTWGALYEYMTFIDEEGQAGPAIAQSWSSDDGKTWTMNLGPGQSFHNGRPLNANAVTEAVDFLLSEDGKRFSVSRNVKRASVIGAKEAGDLEVVFTLSRPNPVFPSQIAALPLYEPQHFAEVGIDAFTTDPVGSGPFKLDSWTGNGAVLNAFEGYRTGKPKIDRLELIEIPEGAARLEALVSGQIDIDIAVLGDDFARIREAGGTVSISPAPRIIGISLISAGQKDGVGAETPFADKRVRQAVNYAVNKQAMVDTFLGGVGRPASQAATPSTFGYDPTLEPYPYDPEKARALLAEAGYADGFKFTIQATVSNPANKLMYESAVGDLRKVGIDAELIPINFPTWLKAWQQGTWDGQGFGYGYFLAPDMDAGKAFSAASCDKKPEVSVYYCDQDEMKLLSASEVELDVAERKAILQKLLKVHRDNAPILMLVETQDAMGVGPRVKNFKNTNLVLNYADMDIAE